MEGNNVSKPFRIVDIFAGMGGFRLGFERAGAVCVYSIEWDENKRRVYKVVHGEEPDANDIRSVRAADIPEADIWTFGSPCQNFSVSGGREGLNGDKSCMVREVFRLLKEKQPEDRPDWLLLENVKGLLSSNRGWDFATILAEMDECGYDCEWNLLNAKDFGVPQSRERVYVVGCFRGRGNRPEVFPIRADGE